MEMKNNPQTLLAFFILLYIFCWSGADDVLAPMEKNEQEALYSTVQDFVGKDWNGFDLYPDPCGWTPIQGISCDFFNGFWHVTDLNLGQVYDNSLNCSPTAEFGYHLFELRYLRKLTFTNCFLSSHHKPIKIPESRWDKLASSLEHLEFRSNIGLTGKIPATLGCVTKLESLVLIENGLTGELPPEIGNFIKLKRLVLSENRFTGEIPASLGGLSQLLIFDASRNFLTGELPHSFGGLTSLLKLDLSSNLLVGSLPSEIGGLRSLTLLDFSYNNFSSGGLTESSTGDLMEIEWKNLQNLEVLDFSYSGVTGNLPTSMSEMKKLRFLGLNNNRLTGNAGFTYEKDSVMEVTQAEYEKCRSSHPRYFSNNGNTIFTVERGGLFYFISGVSGHCQRGVKMVIKVLEPETPPQPTNQTTETSGAVELASAAPSATILMFIFSVFAAVFM